ncbi:hypothetical protein AUR64_09755 [Haloprofundus marisrubri]|uniref:Uncharacterized protein n=1 Tax=Haloprofundus marisrubri TaxID=1514971 RepID=A0A0W1R8W2_9EURY|nr:hypothetical protein [Haloprofundus marisrubri]KTG09900.1 hypothetical protein AUR64_09755 [Haloprofundus marisrubri]
MSSQILFRLRRALRYVAAAAGLAVVIGYFQQGSIEAGLLFGLAVGAGVAIGLVLFEVASR